MIQEKISADITHYESFPTSFIEVLNEHVPLRNKFLRDNNAPHMTKTLRRAIMRGFELETKYFKRITKTDLKLYKKAKKFLW